MGKDYYKILEVDKKASIEDIKKSFKKLARQYHPDLNPGDQAAEKKFKEISEAFEVLGDEKKRQQYDRMGSFDFGGQGPQDPFSQNFWQSSGFNQVDLEDIFGDIFGFGGPTRGRRAGRVDFNFGGQPFGARGARPRDGADILWKLPIDFLEAAKGTEKQVLLNDGKKIKVKIPAGVNTGSKIRVPGKGHPGVAGGKPGHLFIEVEVAKHKYFRREGDDVHVDVPITLQEALDGAKIDVPTIDGNVALTIPASSQSGQKLRLKNKGTFNLKTKQRGHQYVHLMVQTPKLSDTDKKTLLGLLKKDKTKVRQW